MIILTICICLIMFFIIFKISMYITKYNKKLSIILALIFLFQFIVFPEFIAYTGETSVYYMEAMYNFDLIPTDTPIVFLIFWFFINTLSMPEFLVFNLFRAIVTTVSALFIFKIIIQGKRLYIDKYKNIGYLGIILFGFNYIQFFYMAGDQYKNLLGNLMYIILVYFLIKYDNDIKYQVRNILYIILFSMLTLLSHKMYLYILPLTLGMAIILRYKIFNSLIFISMFSLCTVIFLRIQDQFRMFDVSFLNNYLDYSIKYGDYKLIDGFNHLGNTLTFFIGITLIIYYIVKYRLNNTITKKYLLLFYIFIQLFMFSHSYIIGVVLTPFRFTMINLPFMCIFISMFIYKYIPKAYYLILSIIYLILNIAFIQFSVNSSSGDYNDVFKYLLNSLYNPGFILGEYVVYIVMMMLCILSVLWISTYIKE